MKKRTFRFWILIFILARTAPAEVRRIDIRSDAGFSINAAGPLLVRSDEARGRVILANTLTSSLTVIQVADGRIQNIPVGSRVPPYLKAEALTLRKSTGDIYLIGSRCLMIVDPSKGTSRTVPTPGQFEAVAADETSGNAFLVGRASRSLGFLPAGSSEVKQIPWLDREEEIVNQNMTPKPPLRKIIADSTVGMIALDAWTSTLYCFRPSDATLLRSRKLALNAGGRWHLAGYRQEGHQIFLVTETEDRKALQAACIGAEDEKDRVIALPGLTEPVGIAFSTRRNEVYIAYDNHPTVHVVEFREGGQTEEIAVPGYGNDAVALDEEGGRLFVASWAWSDLATIRLDRRSMVARKMDLGILPHQFSMAWHPASGKLYIPLGATAVNGSFGAAVTTWEPETGRMAKIRTGWAPMDLARARGAGFVTVFGSEDEAARVYPDGRVSRFRLPVPYPIRCTATPDGKIALAYGAHQSWWPVVYIRGARNGLLLMDPGGDGTPIDRRLPRQAQDIASDASGRLFLLQNNWGREKQFISCFGDAVREWDPGISRFETGDEVERETTQRILALDEPHGLVYLVRNGEQDVQNGVLHVMDGKSMKTLHRVETGRTPTGLAIESQAPEGKGVRAAVANFDSDTLTVTERNGPDFSVMTWKTGRQPLRVVFHGGQIWVLTHRGRTLECVDPSSGTVVRYPVPWDGLPDQFLKSGETLWLSVYGVDRLGILKFDLKSREFSVVETLRYPYGDTALDSGHCSFFNRGQFGDAIFSLSRMIRDENKAVWIADFLSGSVFHIRP